MMVQLPGCASSEHGAPRSAASAGLTVRTAYTISLYLTRWRLTSEFPSRHWYVSAILSDRPTASVLCKHSVLDPIFTNFLHDGNGRNYLSYKLLQSEEDAKISWVQGPVVGKLFDKYGPRYLIIVGTFLHVFGLMMASISTQYYQLLLSQGVCSAIGVAAIFQPGKNT